MTTWISKLCLTFSLSALELALIQNISGVVLVRTNHINTTGLCQYLCRELPREKTVRQSRRY